MADIISHNGTLAVDEKNSAKLIFLSTSRNDLICIECTGQ